MEPQDIVRSPWFGGAIGALIAALRPGAPPETTWREKAFNTVAGLCVAGFLAPALIEWLGMKSPGYQSGCAFVLGLTGMSLAGAVLQGIRDTPVGQIITGWLSWRPKS